MFVSCFSVFGTVQPYGLWSTSDALFQSWSQTIYDNTQSFSTTTGRISWSAGTLYRIHVSYRPQLGYYRTQMIRASDNFVVADSGNQYRPAEATSVCFV